MASSAAAKRANLASCALAVASLASCLRDAAPHPPAAAPIGTEPAACKTSDRLCLVYRNEMSSEFETERLLVVLDSDIVFDRQENLSHADHVVYSGPAASGEHQVHLLLRMKRGHLHFEARSTHAMTVAENGPRPDRLISVAYEKPQPRLEERPAIRYVEEPAVPATRAMTIWVSKNGEIELDGKPTDVEAVGRSLEDLSKRGGVVVYGVDASQNPPHPNAKRVIEWMARPGLSVRLSTARDFSDVVDTSSRIKVPPPKHDAP
jgi:hypothetical protein